MEDAPAIVARSQHRPQGSNEQAETRSCRGGSKRKVGNTCPPPPPPPPRREHGKTKRRHSKAALGAPLLIDHPLPTPSPPASLILVAKLRANTCRCVPPRLIEGRFCSCLLSGTPFLGQAIAGARHGFCGAFWQWRRRRFVTHRARSYHQNRLSWHPVVRSRRSETQHSSCGAPHASWKHKPAPHTFKWTHSSKAKRLKPTAGSSESARQQHASVGPSWLRRPRCRRPTESSAGAG